MSFEYCDLFAGIGGFHAALDSLGGHCAFASEIDPAAAAVYERNWGPGVTRRDGRPVVEGDIFALTDPAVADHLPSHDVLVGGFPCQPFSKSGYQRGINETRGTLFFNIAQILRERQPSIVFLENVRNLVGPRHESTWRTIISTLRSLGYRVSDTPTVFSPHLLPQECGGSPQVRERVFILGTYVGVDRAQAETSIGPVVPKGPVDGWNPQAWDLNAILTSQGEVLESGEVVDLEPYALSVAELGWIAVWDECVQEYYEAAEGASLPGFPIWADEFRSEPRWTPGMPKWKRDFLQTNSDLYNRFRHSFIDDWLQRHDHLAALPPSRRKLEWQAQ